MPAFRSILYCHLMNRTGHVNRFLWKNKSVLLIPRRPQLWQHSFCSAREQASSLRAAHPTRSVSCFTGRNFLWNKKAASNVALPGNSDHNFSKSPAEKQSIPFIRLMLYGGLKVLPNSRLSGHNPKYYLLLVILAVCEFLCLIATIIK